MKITLFKVRYENMIYCLYIEGQSSPIAAYKTSALMKAWKKHYQAKYPILIFHEGVLFITDNEPMV